MAYHLTSYEVLEISRHPDFPQLIPASTVEELRLFWKAYPKLFNEMLIPSEWMGYYRYVVKHYDNPERGPYFTAHGNSYEFVESAIQHEDIKLYADYIRLHFERWFESIKADLILLPTKVNAKAELNKLLFSITDTYAEEALMAGHSLYAEMLRKGYKTILNDIEYVRKSGWNPERYRMYRRKNSKEMKDIGWNCDLLPPRVVREEYFEKDQRALDKLDRKIDECMLFLGVEEDKYSSDKTWCFERFSNITKKMVTDRKRELLGQESSPEQQKEITAINEWLDSRRLFMEAIKRHKIKWESTSKKLYDQYDSLSEEDIIRLVVEHKWKKIFQEILEQRLYRLGSIFYDYLYPMLDKFKEYIESELDVYNEIEPYTSRIIQLDGNVHLFD